MIHQSLLSTNNIATQLTNQVHNQSTISSTDVINWLDTTHFDSGDDYCAAGCRNVGHCQQQQTWTIKLDLLLKLFTVWNPH